MAVLENTVIGPGSYGGGLPWAFHSLLFTVRWVGNFFYVDQISEKQYDMRLQKPKVCRGSVGEGKTSYIHVI